MKRFITALVLSVGLAVVGTGCLKDKGFDEHKYGLTDPASQPKGVSFVESPKNPNVIGLDVSTTTQKVGTQLTVEADQPAANDIVVTLVKNDAAVTAAGGLLLLPTSAYTAPTLTLTIPKGSRSVDFNLNVTNTTALDPNKMYGVAYTITSVSGGDYQIAANNKTIVFAFNIKNAYDGLYKLNGYLLHPTASTAGGGTRSDIELRTAGPSSVVMFWRLVPDYAHPIWPGGTGLSYFATQAPVYTIDPATNKVTSVVNYYPAGVAYTVSPAATYNSRWDPATKTLYAQYSYSAGSRVFTDTLRYLGPR